MKKSILINILSILAFLFFSTCDNAKDSDSLNKDSLENDPINKDKKNNDKDSYVHIKRISIEEPCDSNLINFSERKYDSLATLVIDISLTKKSCDHFFHSLYQVFSDTSRRTTPNLIIFFDENLSIEEVIRKIELLKNSNKIIFVEIHHIPLSEKIYKNREFRNRIYRMFPSFKLEFKP